MTMLKRIHLPATDLEVSGICYGGGGFGTACRGEDLDRRINLFREAGGNFLDTAHCYGVWAPGGDGASERAIGSYLRRFGKKDLVVGTKGGHPSTPGYRKTDAWLSPGRLGADIDDSLARLDVDAIDLYWLHRDDTRLTPGGIIETLNAEVRRGRIRFLGASNWRTARIAAANAYAAAHGLRGFVASQPQWSLACRNVSPDEAADTTGKAMVFLAGDDLRWHEQTKLPVIPYSSNAGGYLATGGQRAKAGFDNPTSRARLERCGRLAAELGATAGQVALAWLLHQSFPVIPIIGALDPEHLRQDLGAADVPLTAEQVRWLAQGDGGGPA